MCVEVVAGRVGWVMVVCGVAFGGQPVATGHLPKAARAVAKASGGRPAEAGLWPLPDAGAGADRRRQLLVLGVGGVDGGLVCGGGGAGGGVGGWVEG